MEMGDVKRLGDVALPAGVELLEDPDRTVVSVSAPTFEATEEEVAEGEEALDVEEGAEAAEGAEAGDDAGAGE